MPVSVPSDRRFRRSRVSPSRRASWRDRPKRIVAVVAGCAVTGFALYGATAAALSSPALAIRDVHVYGNERISTGAVRALLDGLRGENIITADLDGARQKLLVSPWIAEVAIRRVFPDALSVALTERHAMGIGRVDGALYLIDGTGTIIDEFGPNYADLDLPIVDGLAARREGTFLVDPARSALAGRLLSDLRSRPGLAARVSQVDVSDARNAVVMLKDDTVLIRVGTERFAERLQAYVDLASHLRERVPDIDYVDLRYDERVYVKPQPAAPARKPAAGRSRG